LSWHSDGAKSGRWVEENRRNGAVFSAAAGGATSAGVARAATVAAVPYIPVTDVQPSSIFKLTELSMMKIMRPEN
jgi:hypothetical protein